jgi:uncharacterized protein (DUF433 family)
MGRTITVSDQLYSALEKQAKRGHEAVEQLTERWLSERLDLARYPELVWREGPGGWRAGIRNTAIDVYTIIGYIRAGYTAQDIADDLLPQLSIAQINAASQYYAEHPDDVDSTLRESEPTAITERLQRVLGSDSYGKLVGQ